MSKLIYRKPGRGKTLAIIQHCCYCNRKDGGDYTYILVADKKRALWLSNFAKQKGYNIPFPITVAEVKEYGLRGSYIKHILVDDVEDVLFALVSHRVDIPLITMSKDDRSE